MSKALYDGQGPPDDEFGGDGDFYLNTLTYVLYGPKNSGAWPLTGKNLVGPAGTQGANGAPGSQGPAGPAPSGTGVVTVTGGALNAPGAISLAGSLVANVLPLANQRDEGVKRLSIMAGSLTHGSSTRRQVGSIVLDTSLFPSAIGGLTRKIRFLANVQKSSGATNVQAILHDADHNVDVSTLTSTSNSVASVTSAPLTEGSSAGNIRTDVATLYEVQVVMNGVVDTDQVVISNAALHVTYE